MPQAHGDFLSEPLSHRSIFLSTASAPLLFTLGTLWSK